MKLFATPKSHFSRKIRLLLDHWEQPYQLIDVGNVATADPTQFHHNPAMQVPVLEDDGVVLLESDHIASYLTRKLDPADRFGVNTQQPDILNARAVMNNIMANEVKLILAARTGLDPKPHAYFQKAEQGIRHGLRWLEDHISLFQATQPSYADFHLICMWDHLDLYETVTLPYPQLRDIVAKRSQSAVIRASHPLAPFDPKITVAPND
ncbi:glutathione S-transferase family protein [Acanthopleuribacter pedis]|uniref:Glutathione S-transferase family protein n=1 Tax=Acanthopleuribacter pedis TaxID=442870 RepID=A0A8J7U609_9BACT|nr:glutathione S-transferase family protein [Acanthopleuribacter pedis]MBO1323118.1 glutathione S-transferase family protein [Acanthopleuribacter pedis]